MKIRNIIIHCSDSTFGCASLIRKWHTAPLSEGGRGWSDIGYHFVVTNGEPSKNLILPCSTAAIEVGRVIDADGNMTSQEVGAHTLGMNGDSLGICLIGKNDFCLDQRVAAAKLCCELCQIFSIPVTRIMGHCETPSGKEQGKTCPNLDMVAFRTLVERMVSRVC